MIYNETYKIGIIGGIEAVTVGFYTLGCKVNQYETQALSRLLENQGIMTVALSERPDVIVLNSCTVTAGSILQPC